MHASMSYEVNGLGSGPRRMVSGTEGQMVEIKTPVFVLRESVHEPKRTSGRRDVDLHAAGETGAVPRILITRK
jgi:hypothetical protein